jgi:Ser/Thr protein kinase RdoA (MazF antagonist)
LWGSYTELAALSDDQRRLLSNAARRVREVLDEFGMTSDRYGLVHADLVPDNVMETAHGLAVIDFDDCGYGWYLWELATAVFWHIGQPTYEAARDGYIAGYRDVRDLPDDHLAIMPAILVMRALVYLGWMHSRRHTETAREHTAYVVELSIQLANEFLSVAPATHTK